jgi:dCMP deaminase
MKKIVIAYVPVLHAGYKQFFEKHNDKELFILGKEVISEFSHLEKEIRQLDPELVKEAVESWKVFENVQILDQKLLKEIAQEKCQIWMPREDVMLSLWQKYFPKHEIFLDPIFLRWDKHNTVIENDISPDIKISSAEFDKKMMAAAENEAEKSSDWWRIVGSVVTMDGKIILASHNRHLPNEHAPYVNGDPRNNFHKGVHLELGTSIHGEASVIAEAAKKGISLEGAEMYVSHFPCPPCAKLVACSGIKRLYYRVGYGVLDGEAILKQFGVEIIQVIG